MIIISVTIVNLSAAVLRNHRSNDLRVWYDDRCMYLIVYKGLQFCTGAPLGIYILFWPIVMKLHRNYPWVV